MWQHSPELMNHIVGNRFLLGRHLRCSHVADINKIFEDGAFN